MKTITINVTQEDIDEGIKKDCERCPVALAAGRVLPNIGAVTALVIIADFEAYDLPGDVTAWINHFDYGFPVKPITFEIKPSFPLEIP